jgi:serine/threonine protein kinase
MAPEKADVWALGVVLFELCSLKRPYQGKNVYQLYNRF